MNREPDPEDDDRIDREKEAHRAQIRRGNELARKKDFEAHGMEYKPDSLEASPSLLALLNRQKRGSAA